VIEERRIGKKCFQIVGARARARARATLDEDVRARVRARVAPPLAESNSRVAAFVTILRDIFRRIKTGEHNLAAAVVGEATDALVARRTCAV
jgi:hypothetical protein